LISTDFTTFRERLQRNAAGQGILKRGAIFMLKPLANLVSGVTRPHYPRHDHRYSLAGALVVLAVAIGTILVLLVDWLNTLTSPLTR
jgi:hypothetical protein